MEYNILLNVDIDDLHALCLSHCVFTKICNDASFWIDRFNHDNILLYHTDIKTIKNWIKEYNRSKKITFKINKIMQNNEPVEAIFYNKNYDLMLKILPMLSSYIKENRSYVYDGDEFIPYYIQINDHLTLTSLLKNTNENEKIVEIDDDTKRKLIFNLFYYNIAF